MSFWNPTDDEIEERKRKLHESWKRITDDLDRQAELERQWKRELDHYVSDPHALDNLTEDELEDLQVTAKSEIERLEEKLEDIKNHVSNGTQRFTGGWGDLLSIVGNASASAVKEEMHRNKRLLAKVEARLKAINKKLALPPPDPAAAKIAKIAELIQKRDNLKKILIQRCGRTLSASMLTLFRRNGVSRETYLYWLGRY
jgi:DNA repair exonuclease SbcCD ATPase subunit